MGEGLGLEAEVGEGEAGGRAVGRRSYSASRPLVAAPTSARSGLEERYYSLGQTNAGRRLFVVFTLRGTLIRVISARDMSRRERKVYEGS